MPFIATIPQQMSLFLNIWEDRTVFLPALPPPSLVWPLPAPS